MSKEHKYHKARIEIDSALPPEKIMDLARRTMATQKNMQLKGEAGSRLEGVAKSWAGLELLRFALNTRPAGDRTFASTELLSYTTSKSTVMFVPVTPTEMNGYPIYRSFLNSLKQVVLSADPTAKCTVIERELAQS